MISPVPLLLPEATINIAPQTAIMETTICRKVIFSRKIKKDAIVSGMGRRIVMSVAFKMLVIFAAQKKRPILLPKQIPAGAEDKKRSNERSFRIRINTANGANAIQHLQKAIASPWTFESATMTGDIDVSMYPSAHAISPVRYISLSEIFNAGDVSDKNSSLNRGVWCGAGGNRTPDPLLAKQVL